MAPVTPYTKHLGDREPIAVLRETSSRIDALTSGWLPSDFDRTYAAGKWSARQILMHMAHVELATAIRVRMALTTDAYVVQPFDQDRWMEREPAVEGRAAADTYLSLSRLDAALFGSLTPEDRAIPIAHPEAGSISVDWLIHMLAGHQVSHLEQIEQIARSTE